MSDNHDKFHFNAEHIFIKLFILTAAEIAWGYMAKDWGRLLLWGGLISCATWKALLIATYFMHLKFEGWIVKTLIIPTPFLVLVIFGYVIPDVANREGHMIHPIGAQYDPTTGVVVRDLAASEGVEQEPASGGTDGGH
ncbi:MAG: hypothetical protein CMJ89_19210 [Planctomycetes bacterium]|jgi:cytochrome c oxidase subunit 4|nr:hypothetical protein [Planctomycetota bacterium]